MNLNKGLTNRLSLVEKDGKQYVRKQTIKEFSSFINFNNLKKLTNLFPGILSPESKYINNKNYFYESLYLKNYIPFNEVDLKDRNKVISLVASKIKRIHSLEGANLKPFDYRKEILKMFELCPSDVQIKYKYLLDSIMLEIELIKQSFECGQNLVVSHNDVVEGNILFSSKEDKVHLIDFDSCSLNHPIFDVVSFLYENDLTHEERELFCSLVDYEFKKNENQINLMRKYQDALWFFWAKYCFSVTSNKLYLGIAKIKERRLKETNFF